MVLQPLTEHIPHGHRDPVIPVNGLPAAAFWLPPRRANQRGLGQGRASRDPRALTSRSGWRASSVRVRCGMLMSALGHKPA